MHDLREFDTVVSDNELRSIAMLFAQNHVGANRPISELLLEINVSAEQYETLRKNPQFGRYVKAYTKELRESGFSFAVKSRLLAEELLPVSYAMAMDKLVPPPVRAKMIENLVEWGGLKPKGDKGNVQTGPGFSITINLPGSTPQESQERIISEQKSAENSAEDDDFDVIEGDFEDILPALDAVQIPEKSPLTAQNDAEPTVKPLEIDENQLKSSLMDLFEEGEDYVYAGDDVE